MKRLSLVLQLDVDDNDETGEADEDQEDETGEVELGSEDTDDGEEEGEVGASSDGGFLR